LSSLLVISTILLAGGLVITAWIHSQYHLDVVAHPAASSQLSDTPFISVIVPARNEVRNIGRCAAALLAQDYPHYELIIIDDRSSDATPQILAGLQDARLIVLHGSELPEGWAGKPHALVQAADAAHGEWLCFVDADTFASPQLLASTLAAAQDSRADLFTILTGQELGSFWEKVIQPVIFTALSVGFPARRVNDPDRPDAIANGQFILVKRSVYDVVGGHRAVYNRIAEDQALAMLVKGRGCRLVIADGRELASTRMYTSFSEIWEGWTKNIFIGMRDRLGLLLFGGVVGLLGALLLPAWLLGAFAWLAASGSGQAALAASEAAVLWAYLLWVRAQTARAFSISSWYALTLPLGALVFTAMLFTSAARVLSGQGVRWKGRVYRS
jgi:chlorobactene glucosyltransferase